MRFMKTTYARDTRGLEQPNLVDEIALWGWVILSHNLFMIIKNVMEVKRIRFHEYSFAWNPSP